jgi:hypothetical protein
LAGRIIPHAFIPLLEGQGCILGLKEVARLHLHIAFTQTLAALYEVFEVIYIVSRGVG